MKCEICGATPAFGKEPDIILCDICREFFTGNAPDVKHETTPQPVLDTEKEQMERIDKDRPSWHAHVYGGLRGAKK